MSPLAASVEALVDGLVDYAGMYPPAELSLADAVRDYGDARSGGDARMLARFVAPVARLDELGVRLDRLAPPVATWHVSAVLGRDIAGDLRRLDASSEGRRHFLVDAVEARVETADDIAQLARFVAPSRTAFAELPLGANVPALVGHLAKTGVGGKLRTGGVAAERFPEPTALADALRALVDAGVRFKLTAGLHHPLRGEYPMTYTADARRTTMFGFLNVLLATAALRGGVSGASVAGLLVMRDPRSLAVSDAGVGWREVWLPVELLRETRRENLVAIGSCSFREPVDELRAMTSLPA